jgi:predicted amidophosphoribosyltransferase
MHPDKQKQRGFNQAELLAEAFCETARLPLQRRGLKRVRTTVAQFGLAVADREQNLAGAFELDRPFEHRYPNRSVLLIDDIYTTGATARSAAQTFQDHQIKVYGLAAIAKPALGFKKDAQSGESGEG